MVLSSPRKTLRHIRTRKQGSRDCGSSGLMFWDALAVELRSRLQDNGEPTEVFWSRVFRIHNFSFILCRDAVENCIPHYLRAQTPATPGDENAVNSHRFSITPLILAQLPQKIVKRNHIARLATIPPSMHVDDHGQFRVFFAKMLDFFIRITVLPEI